MFSWKSDFEWVQLVPTWKYVASDYGTITKAIGLRIERPKLLIFWSSSVIAWHIHRSSSRWGLTDPINIVAYFRFGSENSFKFLFSFAEAHICFLV